MSDAIKDDLVDALRCAAVNCPDYRATLTEAAEKLEWLRRTFREYLVTTGERNPEWWEGL